MPNPNNSVETDDAAISGLPMHEVANKQARPASFKAELRFDELGLITGLGACSGLDTDLFFPDESDEFAVDKAKAVCEGCDVRKECLDFALKTREDHGVWGGMSASERRTFLRRQSRARRTEAIRAEISASAIRKSQTA